METLGNSKPTHKKKPQQLLLLTLFTKKNSWY